ncbi:MAG TPA: SAM-dependent methyltransferase [Dictyobacter sp.]|nr:SAM-dependent methyltransferase [Dictyobacter sp.]
MSRVENLCIVTAQAEFNQAALDELELLDKQLEVVEEFAPGITLCRVSDVPQLMYKASQKLPVFVRHIAPVQTAIDLNNDQQDLGNLALATIELPGITQLERGVHFSVQTRLVQTDTRLGERPFSSGQINQALAEALIEETGAIEDIKKPEVIVSILCTMTRGYLGISTAEENLSSWPGGSRHFANKPEQISRAEFKLLEATEVFGVILPSSGQALDLGAAPGGWTRLLLEAGLQVIAVDPANMDQRLKNHKRLEHYRGYAENFIEEAIDRKARFDILVNDMRMDARDAARLLVRAAICLRPDGIVISVLKLPHATERIDPLLTLKEALRILQRNYDIVQAHQMFHNRQEVTVVAAQPIIKGRR